MARLLLFFLWSLLLCPRASAAPVEVSLWHAYRGEEKAALDALLDQYNAAHPEVRVVKPESLELDTESKPAKPTIADDDPNYIYLPGKPMKALKREAVQKAVKRRRRHEDAWVELEISKSMLQAHLHGDGEDDVED